MHQVTGEYLDYSAHGEKNFFSIDDDQGFNFITWKPPIHWTDMVGNKVVKFTQTDASASHRGCFDWTDFPEEIQPAIPYIVEAINNAMRVID